MTEDDWKLKYSVGPLLYTPATNCKIAYDIESGRIKEYYSLALCCEDTIPEYMVETAETQIVNTLKHLKERRMNDEFFIPHIFIRVRKPEQMYRLYLKTRDYSELLTGFVLPKYSGESSDQYNSYIRKINETAENRIYVMPILESEDITSYENRSATLNYIKSKIDSISEYVLNIRVGGNDFCNLFAVRRNFDETIYEILPVAQLMSDILSVFLKDYVVSAPVWEFYSGKKSEWKIGLIRELKLDKLNGFTGKTVIHPNQIPVVDEALKVSKKDYEDAKRILHWENRPLLVEKSADGVRMNERKTHLNWAKKILILAEIYGVV